MFSSGHHGLSPASGQFLFYLSQDFLYFKCQAVGLVDAVDFRIAVAGAQQARQLAVAVDAFVVQFDNEDVIETGKGIFEAIGKRIDVADVE